MMPPAAIAAVLIALFCTCTVYADDCVAVRSVGYDVYESGGELYGKL